MDMWATLCSVAGGAQTALSTLTLPWVEGPPAVQVGCGVAGTCIMDWDKGGTATWGDSWSVFKQNIQHILVILSLYSSPGTLEIRSYQKQHMPFLRSLFIIAKTRKQWRCPSVNARVMIYPDDGISTPKKKWITKDVEGTTKQKTDLKGLHSWL